MTTKRCHQCGRTRPLDAFHRDRTKRDGRRSACRDCLAAAARQRAAESRQRDREALTADPTARRALRRLIGAVEALKPSYPTPDDAERIRRIAERAERELRRRN